MGAFRPIGYWLKLLDELIETRLDDTLRAHGLTRREWQILNLISSGARSSDQVGIELAPFLASGEDATTFLDGLVQRDWLQVTDGAYELSEVGEERLGLAAADVKASRQALVAGLTQEEYESTLRTLETMCRNLGWKDEQTS